MKRNRQHIIEKESELILKSTFPSEWVLRKLSPDYGVDYLVEVFSSGSSTGTTFFLQLKGTDNKSSNGEIKKGIDKNHIKYYGSLLLRVLFVYISIPEKKTWGKWAESFSIPEGKKSRTIVFTENDLLNNEKIYSISKQVKLKKYKVILKYHNSSEYPKLVIFIKKWVKHYFNGIILDKPSELCDEISISIIKCNDEEITIKFVDTRYLLEKEVSIPKNIAGDLILYPKLDPVPDSITQFLFELSNLLSIRKHELAINCQLALLPKLESECLDIQSMHSLIGSLISKKRYKDVEKLGIDLIKENSGKMISSFTLCLFCFSSDNEATRIRYTITKKTIETTNDNSIKGLSYYNLANQCQKTDRRKAISYYIKAARFEPDYLNRHYWYRAIGGMLFLEKRYLISASIYQKYLDMEKPSEKPIDFALAADAYFMSRKFEISLKYFEKYISETKEPDIEFILKKQILKMIKKQFGFNLILKPSESLKEFGGLSDAEKMDNEILLSLLRLDPISPNIRFQQGHNFAMSKEFEEASVSYLICALVNDWNMGAWLNSFFMAFETKSHLMGFILSLAFRKCGYELIKYFRFEFLKKNNIPVAEQQIILDALNDQFKEYEKAYNHASAPVPPA